MAERRSTSTMVLLGRFLPWLTPHLHVLLVLALVTPVLLACSLLQPWLLAHAIDVDLARGDAAGLLRTIGAMAALVVADFLLRGLQSWSLQVAGLRAIRDLRGSVFRHVVGLPASFFDRNPSGALLTRTTGDVEALGEMLSSGTATIPLDLLMISAILAAMFWLAPGLTLVSLASAPVLVAVVVFFQRRLRGTFLEVRRALSEVNAFLAEHLYGIRVIQLFNRHARTYEEFKAHTFNYLRATQRSNVYDASLYAVMDGMSALAVAAMLWYGAGQALQGSITPGLLVAFIRYLQMLYDPIKELSSKLAVLQQATAALERIFALLDTRPLLPAGDGRLAYASGQIQFKDVHFAYEGGPDVLHGISFEVQPGQVVALVGSTGSGKTTVGKLLSAAQRGYRGQILLDDVELSSLDPADVRRVIGVVQQDVTLFGADVLFNITLGNPAISEEAALEAARVSQADGFIRELPGGYQFVIAERGANLSAGQGQLIAMARAMAHNPALIVLDEATACVDTRTEAALQKGIEAILERKTVVVIAHRLSTIRKADLILVMDAGRIVELGTHEQLLAAGGRYAELYLRSFEPQVA